MADHVWYIEAAHSPTTARSYVPEPDPALDEQENRTARSRIKHRALNGQPIPAEMLPASYVHHTGGRDNKLDTPIWNSAFLHVREDVAEVLRRFDLGQTVLKPISVTLHGGKGVDDRFLILLTSNVRPTIDPAASDPVPPARPKRFTLMTDKAVHPGVRAYRAALDGPAIWTDPAVNDTIFVNADLAMALGAEPFGKALRLKKVRLSEPLACAGQSRHGPQGTPGGGGAG
jgi:hypothetical protein